MKTLFREEEQKKFFYSFILEKRRKEKNSFSYSSTPQDISVSNYLQKNVLIFNSP